MSHDGGNLFAGVPGDLPDEQFTTLLRTPHVEIERIVSHGQASPASGWYDQPRAEWVMVVAGSADLLFEHEAEPRPLKAGDYVHIPAHRRHRVVGTDATHPTIWLAVHYR